MLNRVRSLSLRPMPVDTGLKTFRLCMDNLDTLNKLSECQKTKFKGVYSGVKRVVATRAVKDSNIGFVFTMGALDDVITIIEGIGPDHDVVDRARPLRRHHHRRSIARSGSARETVA